MIARWRAGALVLTLVLPAAASAGGHRLHPEFASRMAGVKTVGLVTPELDAYEVSANGTVLLRPDWTEKVRANVAQALDATLRTHGLAVKPLAPAAPAAKEELREVQHLYVAVGNAIVQATYANAFPAKLERFEYTVGDIQALLAAEGVDAAVFAYGRALNSSRRAPALVSGSYVLSDSLFVGIVDRSGAVLWFAEADSTASDLRAPPSARYFVEMVTDQLPELPAKR